MALYNEATSFFFKPFIISYYLCHLGYTCVIFLKKREYWKRAFIISFLLTLFYEVTQVTGVYGIFNCAYRIFDVDDLMLNSAGAWLGFFLAPIVWALFPSHEAVQAKAAEIAKNDIVKPLSILLAIIIDLFIVQLILVVVGAVVPNNSIFEFFL